MQRPINCMVFLWAKVSYSSKAWYMKPNIKRLKRLGIVFTSAFGGIPGRRWSWNSSNISLKNVTYRTKKSEILFWHLRFNGQDCAGFDNGGGKQSPRPYRIWSVKHREVLVYRCDVDCPSDFEPWKSVARRSMQLRNRDEDWGCRGFFTRRCGVVLGIVMRLRSHIAYNQGSQSGNEALTADSSRVSTSPASAAIPLNKGRARIALANQ